MSGKYKRTLEFRQRMSQMRLGKYSGKDSFSWKGDVKNIEYQGIHERIKKILPKPSLCQICHLKPPYDLHNIDGLYSMDLKTWQYVCEGCHNHHHKTIDMSDRKCSICNTYKTNLNSNGRPHWAWNNGKLICRACYKRLRDNPLKRRGPYRRNLN